MSATETITSVAAESAIVANEAPGSIALEPIRLQSENEQSAAPGDVELQSATQFPSGLTFSLIFFSVTLFLLLGGLDFTIVATAVPSITDHFHTVADVGWYYTAYRLCSSSLQFAFGKLYTIFPTKRLFIISNSIFICGSIICASAATSSMFVVGRAVTGVGVAGGSAGFFKLVVDVIPLRKRPFYTAIFGMVEGISSIAAPAIGGVIVQGLSWQWCFWINVPVGGAALLALIFLLPETSRDRPVLTWKETIRQLDITGTLVFVPCLTALFIAFNWGGITYSWSDPRIIALFVVFGVLLVVFVIDQVVKGDAAILPLRVMRDRNVIAGSILSICIASSLSIQEYYAPIYFQAVRGYSPARSGYMMFPSLIGVFVAILIQGGGTSYIGYYNPFMIAAAVLMPIAGGLLTTWSPTTSVTKLVCYLAFVGFAGGLGFLTPQTSVQTSLPKADIPLGMAVILFSQNFGPALFVAIAQAIFTNRLAANLHQLAPNSKVSYIESLGLTEIKNSFSGEKLHDVILAFSESISQTWYLALGLACFTIIGSLLTKWRSVKEKEA